MTGVQTCALPILGRFFPFCFPVTIIKVGGFGIGLNIVSLIAKEYNLKIDVKSEINIGTTVEIKW